MKNSAAKQMIPARGQGTLGRVAGSSSSGSSNQISIADKKKARALTISVQRECHCTKARPSSTATSIFPAKAATTEPKTTPPRKRMPSEETV